MSDINQEQTEKIVAGCIKGDRNSQHVLYKMFYGKMLSICLRYSKNPDEARDVLQEGFIKVFSNIKNFGASGSFEGWVRKIIVNTAIDAFRKNRNSIVKTDSDYVETNGTEIMDEENETEYSGITANEIMEAVQNLSPVYKTVFNMYVMDGFSHKEIAEQLGISEGTSKANLFKAKANLKKIFAGKTRVYQH